MFVLLALPAGRWLDRRFARALGGRGAHRRRGAAARRRPHLVRLAPRRPAGHLRRAAARAEREHQGRGALLPGTGAHRGDLGGECRAVRGHPRRRADQRPAGQRGRADAAAHRARGAGVGGRGGRRGGRPAARCLPRAVPGARVAGLAAPRPADVAARRAALHRRRRLQRPRHLARHDSHQVRPRWPSGPLIALTTVAGIAGAAVLPGLVTARDRRRGMLLVATAITAVVFALASRGPRARDLRRAPWPSKASCCSPACPSRWNSRSSTPGRPGRAPPPGSCCWPGTWAGCCSS